MRGQPEAGGEDGPARASPVDPFAELPIPKVDLPRRLIPRRRRQRRRWPRWLWWYLAAAAGYLSWLAVD